MTCKYCANDGMWFNDREDCLIYEDLQKRIVVLDSSMKRHKRILDADNIDYVFVSSAEDAKKYARLYTMVCGIDFPEYAGYFAYNSVIDEWEDILKSMEECQITMDNCVKALGVMMVV